MSKSQRDPRKPSRDKPSRDTGKAQPQLGHEPGNEGEGSRTAARDYNERTEKFIRSGCVEPSAKEAERAVEGGERKDLEDAEKIGKSHAQR